MKRIIIFILISAALVIVCMPLTRPGFFVSDDGGWMIVRLSAFYQSFREGQFPVRFLGRLNNGYGYPVANFLYPGFMYIGSLIHFFGISFIDTVKIIFGGSVIAATVLTYVWLKKYFTDVASAVGAIGFAFAPYVVFDVYHRGSVGEVLALSFAAAGLYAIASGKRWLLGLSIPLLILAHNTLAFVFLGFFALYISVIRSWRNFWAVYLAGVGMAAFFWLPALYERKYVVFDAVTVANPKAYFITGQNAALVGVAALIACILAALHRAFRKRGKLFFISTYVGMLFLVFPISTFIWDIQTVGRIIQFPYRFLSLSVFAGCWLLAYVTDAYKKFYGTFIAVFLVGLGLLQTSYALKQINYTDTRDAFYIYNEATTTVADEFMPKWVTKKQVNHANERLFFYKGRGTISIHTVNSQTIDVDVNAAESSVIQINTLYYPGWGASVDTIQVPIDYSNSEDVMRIPVPAGQHHLFLAFRETISRFVADCVSLISFIGFIVLFIVTAKKTRTKK